MEQRKCLKESLISRHKPELLGDLKELERPESYTEDSIKELQRQMRARREMIDRIPDSEMPMEFHIYGIKSEQARLELEIDYHWEVFGVSYSGSKKKMKQFKEIARDLYLYYGVSEVFCLQRKVFLFAEKSIPLLTYEKNYGLIIKEIFWRLT